MVGPFIFFDQMGPAEFVSGQGVDVRPHPHIGLATVTYLFRGEFQHRDSLGSNQVILPGAVNWMLAGRGVTHSERTSAATRKAPHSVFGIQTWVALPEAQEDAQPSFEHHGKESLPVIRSDGASVRLILGRAYGETAPVRVFSETFYADADLRPGSSRLLKISLRVRKAGSRHGNFCLERVRAEDFASARDHFPPPFTSLDALRPSEPEAWASERDCTRQCRRRRRRAPWRGRAPSPARARQPSCSSRSFPRCACADAG